MAIVLTDDKHYKNIASAIREWEGLFEDDEMYLPEELPTRVTTLANRAFDDGFIGGYDDGWAVGFDDGYAEGSGVDIEAEYQKGYEQGYTDGSDAGWEVGRVEGYREGYDKGEEDTVAVYEPKLVTAREEGVAQGIEQGKQTAYDEFADEYQRNGTRTDYTCGYAGLGWTNNTFKPNHDITPANAYMMFRGSRISGDLVEICENLGITLNFSNCKTFYYTFSECPYITRVGTIDLSLANMTTAGAYLFYYCTSLKKIDLLILPNLAISFSSTFDNCKELEDLTIEGNIQRNIDFKSCKKLTVASAKNIITSLANFAGTSSEYAYYVYFSAETVALLEAEGNTAPHGGDWIDYIASKGWNT